MRCPACGHENSDLATRCAACGSTLPSQTEPDADATIPKAGPTPPDGTAERPQIAEAPQPAIEEPPELRDVAGTAGKFVSSRWQALGEFFSAHQKGLGVGLAVVIIGVFGIVWLTINLLDAPTFAKIEADMAELLPSYEYAGGTYGPDLSIPLSGIAITERSSTQTPEGMEATNVVGRGAYAVETEATFDDGKIRVVRDVGATYVRGDDDWYVTGELAERGTSFTARSGVDENKVLANVGAILDAASAGAETSLTDVYADGTFSIVGNVFREAADKDTATNDVTIHCAKDNGFYAYEGNVIAHFAFESGTWALRSAEGDGQIGTRTYGPLVGTWTGGLVDTQSNGASCYGAQGHELVVTIDSIGDPSEGRSQVKGSITTLAHYHRTLEEEALSTEGDTVVEQVSFSGSLRTTRDETTGSNLTMECTTTGNPRGELEFTLSFGTDEDPSAVVARVASTYSFEELVLLLIPHQTTASFVDTYLLAKV